MKEERVLHIESSKNVPVDSLLCSAHYSEHQFHSQMKRLTRTNPVLLVSVIRLV